MNPESFYEETAKRNIDNTSKLVPEPITFTGKWGSRSRIQIAYEMLSTHGSISTLLDVGCGGLENLVNLEKLFQKGYGIDIARYPSWELLSDKFETSKINLDSTKLPFSDSMFDAVTILMVLEHVFDPFTTIEEISRVTKDGGYLIINVPNIAYIKHRFGLLIGKIPVTSSKNCWENREWDGGHIHYFTLEKLTWLLEKFGSFKVLEVQSSGKFGPVKRLVPELLCSDLQLLCQKIA